ncbi:MAG: hypothetical protein KDA45_01720 [Planctomycetales bacterium]|nr:hypothetical protein [Planctomycetales bacterium]
MAKNVAIVLDRSQLSERELADELRRRADNEVVQLVQSDGQPLLQGLAAGLSAEITIDVEGAVGSFLFLLGTNAQVEVKGNVGNGCAHSMHSGRVVVRGNAGHDAGAFAVGGFLAILGQAGDRCGHGLAGGDVLVRSKVGRQAGYGMSGGVLVLGNGAGEELGYGMSGGVIYVRGEVKSTAATIRPTRMKDSDSMRLSLLLVRAGIKTSGAEFKAYRARAVAS